MHFTYAKDSSDLSLLRVKVGDTDDSRQLFDDAEMNVFLTEESSVLLAAAAACDSLATRFARDYDFTADGASFKKGSVSAQYARRARVLRRQGNGTSSSPIIRQDGYSQSVKSNAATGNSGSSSFDRSGLVN